MEKRGLTILGFLLFFVLLTGCATIVSHSNWPITIKSIPDQADITIWDVRENRKIFMDKTPTVIYLSSNGGYFKGKTYSVQVLKDGFNVDTAEIHSIINPWYFGNVISWIPGFLIVDPLTGAMWKLEPQEINLILKKKGE